MGRELKVEFGRINDDNVEQLRKVNLACFPVNYQDSYYKDVSESKGDGLCKFAYWNGFVVGAACARIEPFNKDDKNKNDKSNDDDDDGHVDNRNNDSKETRIYIMTLGVFAAYRGRSIGTQLIQSVLDHFESHMMDDELKDVVEVSLHVQISNDDAIKFYTEKFGFEKGEIIENYYRRIDPPHCYKLYKKLR